MTFTHVALVGLMGSGKSAVGAAIAGHLGLPLVDVDDEVQARTGRSVRDLWEEGGEAAYRPLEQAIVVEALAPGRGTVLAAPGGVAVDPVAGEALRQPHVAVVYLRGQPGTLAERIRMDDQPRPLLGVDAEDQLADMYAARDGWYTAVADRVEDVEAATPGAIAQRILDAFGDALTPVAPEVRG